jgi:hypothetical protein
MVRNKEGTLMVQSGNHKTTLDYALSMVFNKKQRNDIKNRFEELGVDTEEDYVIDILWEAIDEIVPEFQDIETYREIHNEERTRNGNKTKTEIAKKAYKDAKNGSPIKGRKMETECKYETSETNHIHVEAAKIFIRRIPWSTRDELKTWITSKMQNVIFKSSIGFSFTDFTKELEVEEEKQITKIKEEEMENKTRNNE